MLDLRRLRMLAELERLGTIAAVADELKQTASGVSMQLAALEREVGVPLTERRGRRVVLTSPGSVLAAHARDILDRMSLAELEVEALRRGTAGTYSVGAFPSAARTFVAEAWRGFLVDDPGLDIRLVTLEPEDALAALSAGRVDLAVIHSYSNVPRETGGAILTHPLGEDALWFACREEEASVEPDVDLADYARYSWITPTPELTCFEAVDRACGLAGFRPSIVAESTDFSVQLELVAAGAGVALVPALTVDRLPAGVALRPLRTPVTRNILSAVRAPSRTDAGIQALSDRLAAAARATLDRLALTSH